MPVDVSKTLRQALSKLSSEKERIDRQIAAIETALQASDGRSRGRLRGLARASRRSTVRKTKRRRMSAAARKAVGKRMKVYWAKRRARSGKKKATTAKKNAPAAVQGE